MNFSPSQDEVFSTSHGRYLKKRAYLMGIFCLVTGYLFMNASFTKAIIELAEGIFSISLDIPFRTAGFSMTGSCLVLFSILLVLYHLAGNQGTMLNRTQFVNISLILILLFYWNTLLYQMVNAPITDDSFTVLNFLNSFMHVNNAGDQWKMMYAPYVETRNVMTKCLVISAWKIAGYINFKWFIILINMALTGIAFLFSISMNKLAIKKLLLIPLALLIFQFSYYDAQLWTTAGIHIVFTMFFACLTFYLLGKKPAPFFLLACITACLAAFTYGNGLLVFPIGLFILLIKRQKYKAMTWTALFIFVLFNYFHHYHPVRNLAELLSLNPVSIIAFCLTFWGSCLQLMYRPELPVLAGSLMLLLFLWLTRKKYFMLNPFNYSILLYIILSAGMAALYRLDAENGFRQALANRYGIYSCMGICSCIVAMAEVNHEWFRKKILGWFIIGSAGYYLLSAFFFFPETTIRKEKLSEFVRNVKAGTSMVISSPAIPPGADTIMTRSIRNGIFKP